jgi:four helix bundle protein
VNSGLTEKMPKVTHKKIQSFKDLLVWQKGIEITDAVYSLTIKFPDIEKFGLTAQMQRAAVSIPSNIAEGFGRRYTKELQQFCRIALGSCCELETQLIIAKRRNYLSEEVFLSMQSSIEHESRMLMSLIKGLYD